MTVRARIAASAMDGVTALYRHYIAEPKAPIHDRLASVLGGENAWSTQLARRVAVEPGLCEAVQSYNAALGVNAQVLAKWSAIADGSVRTVVTGQQPGALGGPLLSLYKAATAIALARRIESTSGQRCVPVFWSGSDDDDFAEVRELSVLGRDGSRLDVSIDGSAYRPGLRVGDVSAAAVRAVWNAVTPALPTGPAHDQLGAMLAAAGDFADASARTLAACTGGQIIVVDARMPSLKRAGRDLLLRFFEKESTLRDRLETDSRALAAEGYHAQVQWGHDSGLFVVEDGIRLRVPPEQRDRVRARIERDITVVSPGVVARNVLQDAVFAPLAVVLGPSEIAYRAQMTGIYRELGVAMPLVAPRLSATYLPPAVDEMLSTLGLDARGVVEDPAGLSSRASAGGGDTGLKAAASTLEATFASASGTFVTYATAHLDARARQKLEKRIEEISNRLAQALTGAIEQDSSGPRTRWPFLPRMTDMFRKDSVPQERFLNLATPMLFHDAAAWRAIDALAEEWTGDALDGRVWHGVYSV